MTQTAITTTARRIARVLNGAPRSALIEFDVDGHETGRNYQFVQGDLSGPHVFWSRPDARGGRWTQRDIQTQLDACAAVVAELDAAEWHLGSAADELAATWERQDAEGQERITASRWAELTRAVDIELNAGF